MYAKHKPNWIHTSSLMLDVMLAVFNLDAMISAIFGLGNPLVNGTSYKKGAACIGPQASCLELYPSPLE